MVSIRTAQTGEGESLSALCVRSKAHWGYDAAFMAKSAAALCVSEADIAAGRVVVAVDGAGRTIGVAGVVPDGEIADLDLLFVDPPAIGGGAGRVLFEAAVGLARRLPARRVTMLADGKVVRQALIEGRDAAREGLAPGSLVLDMSSSNPVDTQKLARDLAAAGSALLDAPVSGGVKRAVDGSLSIMVGGAAADLERARPVFGAMGKTVTLCGPAGAGHALKALNNYLAAAALGA